MKREEEIRQYLKERNIPITSLEANSIIEGIEWADKHPILSEEELEIIWQKKHLIEKACNWLDINFPTTDYSGSWYKEGFIKQFKKAMEE